MKAILTLSAALLFVTSPFYSGSFRGFAPEQFPVLQTDPPIVPAGYAFAIWGLIYGWLVVHAGFGLLKRDVDAAWDKVRWPLIISLAVGASWIPVAKDSALWATILIWIMLLTALVALFRGTGSKDRWLLQAPLAIYAGWLTAASFVSIAMVGAGYGVMTDQVGWAWIALIAAMTFATLVQLYLPRVPEYGLTVSWALIAVALRNLESSHGLAVLALAGAVAIGFMALRPSLLKS
ncbi:MAG: hypothetical protein V2I51_20410 [Anderseniella sp.]|nr:hypothetical protein [Anderseniella sp.]